MNKIKINCIEIEKISNSTINDAKELEISRNKMKEIISSLDECWSGIDSESYIDNCSQFLEDLKNDSIYFEKVGEYLKNGIDRYKMVAENNYKSIHSINEQLEVDTISRGDVQNEFN